jgi:hypothetical protein
MSQDVMNLETKLQFWAESAFLPPEDLSACYRDSAVRDSVYELLESATARNPADQSLRFLALSIFYPSVSELGSGPRNFVCLSGWTRTSSNVWVSSGVLHAMLGADSCRTAMLPNSQAWHGGFCRAYTLEVRRPRRLTPPRHPGRVVRGCACS